jgi:murein DD-endopeptidase MepM/ murein hydrolase activator NlpD
MINLGTPYVKITVGKIGDTEAEIFQSGDGKLKNCTIKLGEGKNSSSCNFTVYDRDKKLTDKYFTYIESVDGLDPLTPPPPPVTAGVSDSGIAADGDIPDNGEPGQVVFASAQATYYDPFLGSIPGKGQNGRVSAGAYRDSLPRSERDENGNIKWKTGYYAAMTNPKYKLALMRVTNLANGQKTMVKVVDTGPWETIRGARVPHRTRKIDLTQSSWNAICGPGNTYPPEQGVGILNVKIEWVKPETATSTPNTTPQTQEQKAITNSQTVNPTLPTASNTTETIQSIAKATTPKIVPSTPAQTLSGAQITIELGFDGVTLVAYSFIHTSLSYSLNSPDSLEFGGQAANWVLTQRIKNTVYTNMTFKKIAEKITSSYGLTLDMDEEGPKYEYFPQRGRSDYDTLLIEARRLGYRVYTKGATISIKSRKELAKSKTVFVQEYGLNMGQTFDVTHTASSEAGGGARSSEPNNNNIATGERKFEIDPNSGKVVQKVSESVVGTGDNSQTATTGSTTVTPTPVVDAMNTTTTADNQRKAEELRVKGITANTSFPTTPEAVLVDPDTPYRTYGLSKFLDRFWVIDTVEHSYQEGKMDTKLSVYSPLKSKVPPAPVSLSYDSAGLINGEPAPPGEPFNTSAPKFARPIKGGTYTSGFGPRWGRMHRGVDISTASGKGAGSSIFASANGTVTIAGWVSGYGNAVYINHGGGWSTRYAHLYTIGVTVGQTVSQGQVIGREGSTGGSTGTHLHFEIRKNEQALNPEKFIKFK